MTYNVFGGTLNLAQFNSWMNSGDNFTAANALNSNPNMVGMPQGPRSGVPNAGGPYQMGNVNDGMRRFQVLAVWM